MADDLGWHDVGYNGSEIDTPNIDRLAAEGIRLTSFRTTPACTMTRAALMTGRSGVNFGLWYSVIADHTVEGLPDQEYTIAERFQEAGYSTALVGKWHLGHAQPWHHPNQQGFEHFVGCMVCARDYRTHAAEDGSSHDLQRNGQPIDGAGRYLTDLLTAEADRVIRERDGRPLFLMLSYQAPHAPIQPFLYRSNKYRSRGLSLKRAEYAAVVDRLDEAIGVVLDTLESEGMAKDTIVVFLSDNGGSLAFGANNQPFRGEKTRAFEGGIRVPAIIRYPRQLRGGATSDQVARERDLFATLERGAGLPLRAPAESLNIWPQLQGAPPVNDRDQFFVFNWAATFGSFSGVLSSSGWKLIMESRITRDPDFPEGAFQLNHSTQLFNLSVDPLERRDLAAFRPDLVEELATLFDDYAARHPPGGVRGFTHPPEGWVKPADLTELMAN